MKSRLKAPKTVKEIIEAELEEVNPEIDESEYSGRT